MKAQIIQRLLDKKEITVEEAMVLMKEEKEIKVVIEKDSSPVAITQPGTYSYVPYTPINPFDSPFKVTCDGTNHQKIKTAHGEINIFQDNTLEDNQLKIVTDKKVYYRNADGSLKEMTISK